MAVAAPEAASVTAPAAAPSELAEAAWPLETQVQIFSSIAKRLDDGRLARLYTDTDYRRTVFKKALEKFPGSVNHIMSVVELEMQARAFDANIGDDL